VHAEELIMRRSDAGSILSSVLQQQEAVINQLIDGASPHHADDTTHK
jgi:hypothetical protein